MPLCQINIKGDHLAAPRQSLARLRAALNTLPPEAPVIVLIHGFKFSPSAKRFSPHEHILSLEPAQECWKAVSWPRRLGLDGKADNEPLCIALGWEARGTFWQAYCEAIRAGRGLARLIMLIQGMSRGRQVDILAHSLGGRVALSALPHLPAGAMGRAVLMAPAEIQSRARQFIDCPAGRTVDVLNVTSVENAPYDCALEWLVAPHRWRDRALGQGLARPAANWTDIRIDQAETRAVLARFGYDVAAPDRRVCHWSVYLRPGLFPFYAAVLAARLPLAPLRAALPEAAPRRWSRLVQLPTLPLPFPRRQPS